MKRVTPATPPPIRIQEFPFSRRGHPTSMIEHESTRDDHGGFVRSSRAPFAKTIFQAEETRLDQLIREGLVDEGRKGGVKGRIRA